MKRYAYAPRALPIIAGIFFFAVAAAFFLHRGATNDRGLLINRIIELSESGATVFYWILAALSLGFVLAGLAVTVLLFKGKRYVTLDDQAVSVPARWSKAVTTVPYSAIRDIKLREVNGQRFVELHGAERRVTIAAIMLESNTHFDELLKDLESRVGAS